MFLVSLLVVLVISQFANFDCPIIGLAQPVGRTTSANIKSVNIAV
jgi:hypothetical protein